jgi:hypothetical protein
MAETRLYFTLDGKSPPVPIDWPAPTRDGVAVSGRLIISGKRMVGSHVFTADPAMAVCQRNEASAGNFRMAEY